MRKIIIVIMFLMLCSGLTAAGKKLKMVINNDVVIITTRPVRLMTSSNGTNTPIMLVDLPAKVTGYTVAPLKLKGVISPGWYILRLNVNRKNIKEVRDYLQKNNFDAGINTEAAYMPVLQ
jgi:hypothetical protein